jgi:hypothetical protein
MGQTRIQVVALAVLFSAGIGVMAVQASPTCQRFVRTYVTVPVRNRVSKATALAWAKWRVEHPNWKPKPGVTRPKYLMSRKEQMEKVAFACEAPTVPSKVDVIFPPADGGPAPPVADFTPMETTEVTFPDLIPPVVMESPPFATVPDVPSGPGIFIPPYIPPVFTGPLPKVPISPPPPPTPVPEAPSFFLVLLGMTVGWIVWMRRVRLIPN